MNKIIYILFILSLSGCTSEAKKENLELKKSNNSFSENAEPINGEKTTYYEKLYDNALRLWDCDYQELEVNTTLGKAHVVYAGSKNKEIIVLLHGMNASSTMWYPNVKELSKNYQVYAIDFFMEPGKSERKIEVSSTATILNWYKEIFDTLGLEKFSIIGASRGGWLGVNLALKNPDRVENLVLLSPAQTFKWINISKNLFSNLIYTISPKRKMLRKSLQTMSTNVDQIEQDYIDQYFVSTKKAKVSKVFIEMTPFKNEELASLKMPVLVLIGDQDFINNNKSLVRAKQYIRKVEAEEIKNAGHFLSFDQAKIVNQRMIKFLETN